MAILISLVGTGWLAPSNLNHNILVCTRNLVNDNGLAQIVQQPTRQGNVLNLIVTNKPNQLNCIQIWHS